MEGAAKPRIVIAGTGVVGSLVAAGLADRTDVEVVLCERDRRGGECDAGTGLNIGPNAVRALQLFMPNIAAQLTTRSRPWRQWSVALVDGTELASFDLEAIAGNPGLCIRWAELNTLLRAPIESAIRYGCEVVAAESVSGWPTIRVRQDNDEQRLDGIDLLIGADGRYSPVRESLIGSDPVRFAGVALFRLLLPSGVDCPVDQQGQWFSGPARLLAFQVPGGQVYCAGSFPIATDGVIPEAMKQPEALRALYRPANNSPCSEVAFLLDAIGQEGMHAHWARLQDRQVRLSGPPRVVLAGDAAHPMLPTLGQGATQSIEDACVLVDEIRACLNAGEDLSAVPERFAARRQARIEFAVGFSADATDTMLAGADPVQGTLRKRRPEFLAQLRALYQDVPVPR